jgi:hypothetical protein
MLIAAAAAAAAAGWHQRAAGGGAAIVSPNNPRSMSLPGCAFESQVRVRVHLTLAHGPAQCHYHRAHLARRAPAPCRPAPCLIPRRAPLRAAAALSLVNVCSAPPGGAHAPNAPVWSQMF